MPTVVVIAHNIRSAHNVGSIFRTCDGFGVHSLILSGYTPFPTYPGDRRLPHVAARQTSQISKVALGAERALPFCHEEMPPLGRLRQEGYAIIGLEQDERSVDLAAFKPPDRIALLLGEEVAGLSDELREACDALVEIPMRGRKESFNVGVAAGIALYGLLR